MTQLRALAPDLWVTERPFRLPGMELGVRMSVLRLSDGGLLLHSPVEIDAALVDELAALGSVRAVVAPNKVHHLYVASARAAFPEARFFAAPGLPEKQKDLRFDEVLTDEAPAMWKADLEQHCYQGAPYLNEVVFFHRAARTLVATDLVFHIEKAGRLPLRLYLRLTRSEGRLSQTGLIRLITRDKPAARRSRDRILEWDFDRVIMSHGAVVETGGRTAFREALAWL